MSRWCFGCGAKTYSEKRYTKDESAAGARVIVGHQCQMAIDAVRDQTCAPILGKCAEYSYVCAFKR
jgi:hypothetical protein